LQVEALNASKLKTFKKCDSSYLFSVYTDKPKDGTFYVVYVARSLNVWRTGSKEEATRLRDRLNKLKPLISALEKADSKTFPKELEQLRQSVQNNHTYGNIHHAAACNFFNVIRKLCENKQHEIVVNEATTDGCFPLQIAVANEAKESVQELLRLGASATKPDCHLRNAIHYAAERDPEILEV
uniref:ANK_REP_REGION domain-containing protein n=1 Tax=Gongylonema pulchrum TaxID=637853 RepID=A0A183EVW3_9BILA